MSRSDCRFALIVSATEEYRVPSVRSSLITLRMKTASSLITVTINCNRERFDTHESIIDPIFPPCYRLSLCPGHVVVAIRGGSDASGASVLCFRFELLYVRRDTTCHAELRLPVVSVDDGDDGYDADGRRGRRDAEPEVPLRELQQRLQPQGRSDLPSEIRVRPEAAVQVPVLRLLRSAYLECAATCEKVPPWSPRIRGRSVWDAAE